MSNEFELKQQELMLLKQKEKLISELPHLYGWPWYPWAKEFFDTENRTALLCAANQISKSSTQIRKCIDWATNKEKWPKLWGRPPNQFWYLYPSKDVATIEFEKKWIPEFMPRGAMKQSPIYGWTAEYEHKNLKAIHFRSGVSVFFKTYAQDPKTLQSGSCYAVFCDEELPVNLYDELNFRLAGTNGYFNMVFTATLNQEFWWRAMEAMGTDQEVLHSAWKRQISMYDCLTYIDGTETPWTKERIKEIEAKCRSHSEVLRRVYGRFIKDEGRTYDAFNPTKHYTKPFKVPATWPRYMGVDIGSGGETGHPAAIAMIAVRPDYQRGYIYKGWRGDGILTTAGDVYNKAKELTEKGEMFIHKKFDYSAKDFGTISDRLGGGFTKAEKSHEIGEGILNTLLKNDMLFIFDEDDELRKLGSEFINLQKSTPKPKAKDDFCDAARYAIVDIPWDLSAIVGDTTLVEEEKVSTFPKTKEEWAAFEIEERRKGFYDPRHEKDLTWEEEMALDFQEWEEFGN